MAVDRWFGGIPAKGNIWLGTTMITDDEHDFYFIGFNVQSSDLTNGIQWRLYGTPSSLAMNPEQVEVCMFVHPKVTSLLEIKDVYVVKIAPTTRLYPKIIANNAGAQTTFAYGRFAVLPKSTGVERTTNQVLNQIRNGHFRYLTVNWSTADTNEHVLEEQIDAAKPIIQPMHQATPAVANELNVSSTSVNDTLAGTGLQKFKFDYYDASLVLHAGNEVEMNGTTFVNIIATYANVAYISRVYGSQWGSLGHNDGDIFFHDNI